MYVSTLLHTARGDEVCPIKARACSIHSDGYGVCHLPTVPGLHDMECVCWKPVGSFYDQIKCESSAP